MAKVLVCGSVSYDTISLFPDKFSNHINPGNKESLNIVFHVQEMRSEFGGCAMNICYSLMLLGCDAAPVATVGDDFDSYREQVQGYGISLEYIKNLDNTRTAHYFFTADNSHNQIVIFHAGAMERSHENKIEHPDGVLLGVIAPDGIDGMKAHARQFTDGNIPFIFDPGPVINLLSDEDLKDLVGCASWLIMNQHEWVLFQNKTKLVIEEVKQLVEALIITDGDQGSKIFTEKETIRINAVTPNCIEDPAGCGDAYRAGIIYGILNHYNWQTTGQMASLMGAICVEQSGAQNHHFTIDEFNKRYEQNFAQKPDK